MCYLLLYFLVLPEDPDPGSGSDCLPPDQFIMAGTGGLLNQMSSD